MIQTVRGYIFVVMSCSFLSFQAFNMNTPIVDTPQAPPQGGYLSKFSLLWKAPPPPPPVPEAPKATSFFDGIPIVRIFMGTKTVPRPQQQPPPQQSIWSRYSPFADPPAVEIPKNPPKNQFRFEDVEKMVEVMATWSNSRIILFLIMTVTSVLLLSTVTQHVTK